MKKKINKKMLLAEIVEKYPKVAEELMMRYGFHCMGCAMSEMETLEQGAMVHGMSAKEIEKMVEKLNTMV